MALELVEERHVPAGRGAGAWSEWLVIAACLRVRVPAWEHEERTWLHWALPRGGGGYAADAARLIDPGRRAMAPGAPAGASAGIELDRSLLAQLVDEVARRQAPRLHRLPALGAFSLPGEDREAFRRRCFALLGPAARGDRSALDPASLARLAAAIETVDLGAGERVIDWARVGIVWFPAGAEPLAPDADQMVSGTPRRRR